MKVGKAAALVVGGSIILLQIANHKGYIRVNWDRLNRQVDKITDKVEEKTSGQGPKWMDKVRCLQLIKIKLKFLCIST